MKKLKAAKNKILKMSIASKIACGVLVLALVVGAVAYGVSSMEARGDDPVSLDEKTYLSDIVDRITEGKQKYFTILEVVPYAGMGEFKYFVGSDEVEQGILSKSQAELKRFYELQGGYGKKNEWINISTYFSNFGYEMKYNSYQDKYEIKCTKTFYNDVLTEPYRSLLEGRVRVKTVEANDLTDDDIQGADLIVLTATIQDNSTVSAYNYYTGNVDGTGNAASTTGVYKKNGDNYEEFSVNNSTSITYDTYEKVGDSYVSRDISWEMAKKLLDYMETGRDLLGNGKYTKTPVIFSATLTEGGIPKSSNMYKLSMIYRMLGSSQYKDFMENHITTVDAEGNPFLTSTGIPTAALCYEAEEQEATSETEAETTTEEPVTGEEETTGEGESTEETTTVEETTTPKLPSKTMKFVNEFTSEDILKVVDGSQCIDTNPNAAKRVTNDYWVHNNDARMVPSNLANKVNEGQYKGLTERELNNKTVADIVRYLLGCKGTYTPKYNYGKVKVLEVEPGASYKYSGYEGAKALAKKMNINTSEWNANNYTNYMEVRCVSTRELNSITTDLISTYDVIIISDDVGMLNTDSSGVTRYNDRNLDGYIYLAYGDLTKLSSTLMGWMPWEYASYSGTYSSSTDKYGGNKINKTQDNAYILRMTEYPDTTRYSSYNWASTRFVYSSENKELSNQVRYNQVYSLSENTKRVWTDYQWDTLSKLFNKGDLLGVIDTAYYYKDYKKVVKSSVNMMTDVFSDKIGNARFSDNDITAKTMRALQDYADAGKLLVFADCVYDNDGSKIYPTSHLAELMNSVTAPGSEANYLRESNLAGFITHINAMSPKLNFTTYPTPVQYVKNSNGDMVIQMPDNYNRTLPFAFSIDSYANTQYKVKLIIDKNGDGVFADTGKIVTDDTNEIYKTIMVTTDENGHADVKFSSTLSESMNGLVAYKVEVAQMKNDKESTLRSSYIGYTAVKATETKDIKVLQIVPHSQYSSSNSTLALDMAYKLNGLGSPQASNSAFGSKLTAVNNGIVGYNITVHTMYTYEFENKFKKSDPYIKGEDYNTAKDYINANFYDMVVIGFGDIYRGDDISNIYGALDCINDFIENGNSVMFAHDTMSFNSSSNYVQINSGFVKNANGTYSGSQVSSINVNSKRVYMKDGSISSPRISNDKMCTNITLFLRNSTGMDRYGVTLSVDDREGKDKPTYANDKQMSYSTKSSDGKYYVEELQGFSDWVLLRQGLVTNYSTTNNSKGWYIVKPFKDSNNVLTTGTECWWTVKDIERVNEGQVTMFPYQMSESMKVATTHSQYYQLDMEDEELVVWYTLKASSGYYKYREKDGQNNYYIYSKGNVTYTGAGHQNINTSDELKLFVNTIIKAIDSGNSTPEVVVTNGALGSGIYNIYASVGDPYKLKFKATDPDLATIDAADGDWSKVGVFESGRVIWDKNKNGVYDEGDVVMESYSRNGNKLYNDTVVTIDVGTCPALAAYQTEITNQIIADGAYFLIEATDMYGATGTARAKLTTREFFALD